MYLYNNFHMFNLSDLFVTVNPLNADLNPICRLLSLVGAHLIFHVSGLRVKIKWKTNLESSQVALTRHSTRQPNFTLPCNSRAN